ncbi:GntR family transcriptional regulator [Paenibacillus sp. sgz500958]|uniref:GntR family transcriptional regulator n=1 Tax=Paenibacillus sp. sgz500958 TaxID=3242475 RepID=UPI0036D3E9A5
MNTDSPIYIQIMEMIEDDIIADVYKTDDIIISTTQISKLHSVNPTTAVKSISNLADEGVLYKKRGIGMCVTKEAKSIIVGRRKHEFYNKTISSMLNEAKKLDISKADIIKMIEENGND